MHDLGTFHMKLNKIYEKCTLKCTQIFIITMAKQVPKYTCFTKMLLNKLILLLLVYSVAEIN